MITHLAFDLINVLFVKNKEGEYQPDQQLLNLLPRLKAKYVLGVISNSSGSLVAHYPEIFVHFTGPLIFSGEVGISKPNPEIFKLFCARAKCQPKNIIFIDDSLVNTNSAKSLGMSTIYYRSIISIKDLDH